MKKAKMLLQKSDEILTRKCQHHQIMYIVTGLSYHRSPDAVELSVMMTSSNGNIFRVTGPLCREFTGHRWFPLTLASDAELWCFLWSALWINGWVDKHEAVNLRRHRLRYDVTVMMIWTSELIPLFHIRWFKHMEADTKWPPFSRRHFQTHFRECIC